MRGSQALPDIEVIWVTVTIMGTRSRIGKALDDWELYLMLLCLDALSPVQLYLLLPLFSLLHFPSKHEDVYLGRCTFNRERQE